jgi:hypothetical protein
MGQQVAISLPAKVSPDFRGNTVIFILGIEKDVSALNMESILF